MPPTPESESTDSRGAQGRFACNSCKTRKRRCDKALPRCSHCVKRSLPCDYSRLEPSTPAPRSDEGDIRLVTDKHSNIQSIDYATALFLDPTVLRHGQIDMQRSAFTVPDHVLRLLGSIDEMHAYAASYFKHIQTWIPFISKKRFYEFYLRPSAQSQPDILLLLLSMKLVTTHPPPRPRNLKSMLYDATKHYHLDMENSGVFSLQVLQAGIVIALYEMLHAIYPAAFLSIGACARSAHALGINVPKSLNTRSMLTLVEVEERRRVWWAIVILDRFVSVGSPGRPFATAEPGLDDILPADESAWDQGTLSLDDSIALSSPMTIHMSKFALVCQAARILSQVLSQAYQESGSDDDTCVQLERTLQYMLAAALDIDPPDNDQISFIYSTMLALHMRALDAHARTGNTSAFKWANAAVQYITQSINANLVKRQCLASRDPESMSPWGLYFAYHICRLHMPFRQTSSTSQEIFKEVRQILATVDVRWSIAGIYLELLEAQEASNLC